MHHRAARGPNDAEVLGVDSFDLVVTIFGAMFAPQPVSVAREMVRVAKPSGRIVMGNWIPGDPTLVAQLLKNQRRLLAAAAGGLRQPGHLGRRERRARALRRRRRRARAGLLQAALVRFRELWVLAWDS